MGADAIVTLGVLAVALGVMASELLSPDVALVGALVALVAVGVVDMEAALEGFSNPALVTVGGLLVVAAGLRATGVLERSVDGILGRSGPPGRALDRMTGATAVSSAFVSNTAVVAMGIPAVTAWARRRELSPSRLLIPLSYASILGGVCTVIGTSTNLVADGLLRAQGMAGLGFFETAILGLPCAVVGLAYLKWVAPRLLPDRSSDPADESRAREYLAELELTAASRLAGRTVQEAGLRNLPGLFLTRIDRDGETVAPVDPAERLHDGDHLVFAGVTERIADLLRRQGLRPVAEDPRPDDPAAVELHEAVVSPSSPLVGTSVRDAAFRSRYNAAVVAVHRHGEKIERRIGDIVLRPGDTLLLEAGAGFERAFRDAPDFYLVSRMEGTSAPRHERARRAVVVLLAVVAAAATGLVSLPLAAVGGGLAVILAGCVTPGEARRAVDWSVLVAIGAALGLAGVLESSGAAAWLGGLMAAAGRAAGPTGLLAVVFLGTVLLTETVTNNAAVALAFPVAVSVAAAQGLDPRPFLLVATVAASLSFSSPLGYQTNLMVYGPGGYRFTDFVKVGLPLQLTLGAVAVATARWWFAVGA